MILREEFRIARRIDILDSYYLALCTSEESRIPIATQE